MKAQLKMHNGTPTVFFDDQPAFFAVHLVGYMMPDKLTEHQDIAKKYADAGVHIFHLNEAGNALAFQRYDDDGNIHVVVANFSNGDYTGYRIGLPQPGTWHEALNSQATEYDGNGLTNPGDITAEAVSADGFDQSVEIVLPRMGLVVLTHGGLTPVPDVPEGSGESARLLGAYPNPFNPRIVISFELLRPVQARVTIHDALGRRVRTLVSGHFEAGIQRLVWDGVDDAGNGLASGVYFLRLAAAETKVSQKILLLR